MMMMIRLLLLAFSLTPTLPFSSYESQFAVHIANRKKVTYRIIASPATEPMALQIAKLSPDRFTYHPTNWDKFPDGTDDITIGGLSPYNLLSGENILFLGSFHNNDVTLSQFQVLITLSRSFIKSLTVVLPFYPVGTMERVTKEGTVATAASYAHMFSSLPSCGAPTRLMVYDLHTLQNRFYLQGNCIASLQTTIPLLRKKLLNTKIDCVAFPDDGAAKRFGEMFEDSNLEVVICGKTRDGESRTVKIQEGDAKNKNVVIVDDLVQTGGTLFECGKALLEAGASSVSAYCAHAVFPKSSYTRFDAGGDRHVFEKFWVSNSIPTITNVLPTAGGVFEVLDIYDELVIKDLDYFS